MSIGVTMNSVRSPFKAELLVNIKTTCNFQPPRPHQVRYTLSHITSILTTEVLRNNFEIPFIATFEIVVSRLVLWT
jgi:hypothetical protein